MNPILGLPQGRLDYQCLLVVPGIVVPWGLSRLIGNYYDRTLGRVERLPLQSRLTEWLTGTGFLIAAIIGWVVDSLQRLPVSVSGLIMAGAYFAQWWRTGRLFPHKALLAALLVGLSLLPLTGVPADGHWYDLFGGFVVPITLGIILSIGSVLDHIALVRNLQDLSTVEP